MTLILSIIIKFTFLLLLALITKRLLIIYILSIITQNASLITQTDFAIMCIIIGVSLIALLFFSVIAILDELDDISENMDEIKKEIKEVHEIEKRWIKSTKTYVLFNEIYKYIKEILARK